MKYLLAVLYVPIACVCITAEATRLIGGGKIFLAASEKKMINLHNRKPTRRSLPHLCVHPARPRAEEGGRVSFAGRDTAQLLPPQYQRLTRAGAEGACQRVRRSGYHYRYCGENIGRSSGSEETPENVLYQ